MQKKRKLAAAPNKKFGLNLSLEAHYMAQFADTIYYIFSPPTVVIYTFAFIPITETLSWRIRLIVCKFVFVMNIAEILLTWR